MAIDGIAQVGGAAGKEGIRLDRPEVPDLTTPFLPPAVQRCRLADFDDIFSIHGRWVQD